MRNLLALGALALLGFVGFGWYLGWYKVQSTPTADGHRQIQIDLDTNKFKTDVAKGENKVHDILSNTGTPNQPSTSGTPTGFQSKDDGLFIFPASNSTPPSGNSSSLPPPR